MKWKKLGKIFDPSNFELPFHCSSFAKSPQAIVFDDYVRIYFSAVAQDETGKYLSHVVFVDFDKTFKNILNTSHQTVIPLGNLGCFDEHGIFPFSPVKINKQIYAYTSGWSRRVSVSVETGIGLAISDDDGLTFQKYGEGPVLSASLYEPNLVVDGFVRQFDGIFHMWYIFGTEWKQFSENSEPDRIYKIGHAISSDGINWVKEGKQILPSIFDDESQALPTVIKIKNRFHMFFCYRKSFDFRNNPKNSYRIGYAYSDDLKTWIRDDKEGGIDVSPDGWDSDMMAYPHVFEMDDLIYMLYNGNEFGRYGFGLAQLEC
jgi:sucrose-6-phosphate hydrolase SacC (GH32 family)